MMAIALLSLTAKAGAQTVGALRDVDGAGDEVAENSTVGATVGIAARAANATTYTLIDGAGGLFAIDAQSGTVTVAMALLDHEAFSTHSITVQADNDTSSQTRSFVIRVADVPESIRRVYDVDFNPNKIIHGSMSGSTVGITARAIDPDRGGAVTYSLSEDSTGLFAIGQQDGVVTLASGSYAPDQDYLIEITAMSDDNTSSSAQFTVRRDEPILIAPSPATPTVREGESQAIAFSFAQIDLELKGIGAGDSHSCGITPDNRAVCWGDNDAGRSTPPSDRKFIAVSAGGFHSCGITPDNRAVCWGANDDGQATPPADRKFIAVSAGGAHTCGITPANDAVCWGSNGNDFENLAGQSSPPSSIKFIAISAGSSHSCGVTSANDAVCWGSNKFLGRPAGQSSPPSNRKFIAISAGDQHSCGITLDNDAVCWGVDIEGESSPPSSIKFIAIGTGSSHSCGIISDNNAVCWGSDGQGRSTPPAGKKLIAIAAAGGHTCAITTDNDAVCWGSNLGDLNRLVGQSSPSRIIPAAADPITIAAMISDAGRGQLSHQAQITIPAGEMQATLTVTVADDDVIEA